MKTNQLIYYDNARPDHDTVMGVSESSRRGALLLRRPLQQSVGVRNINYTESGENHGTMVLDGVCYSAVHFGRIIL